MERAGAPLDRTEDGRFRLSLEAAHTRARIARVGGDGAGRAIHQTLIRAVRAAPHISFLENAALGDLLVRDRGVMGASFERFGARLVVHADATILATGGVGGLFSVTTNPPNLVGAGIAAAAAAGAVLRDMEFQQFHPTALDVGRDPAPLATEALRGAGATLIDRAGRRLMTGLHDAMELAPRDVVARGVFASIQAGRGAFLDARAAVGDAFPERFPAVFQAAMAAGVDPRAAPMPVAPAMHYLMGGIAAGMNGRTSLEGLWAVGECAATGLHGANRLASNSLTEGLVMGTRAGKDARDRPPAPKRVGPVAAPAPRRRIDPRERAALRRLMSAHLGVVRHGRDIAGALAALVPQTREPHARTAARLIAAAALLREESRGGHHREDHPGDRAAFAVSRTITLEDADALSRGAGGGDAVVAA